MDMHFLLLVFSLNSTSTSLTNEWLIDSESFYYMAKERVVFYARNEYNIEQIFVGDDRSNALNNRRTSSKYPNTFVHHNSHVLNNDYMISIYTYSHIAHVALLLLGRSYYIDIYTLLIHLTPYSPPLGSYHTDLTPYMPPLGSYHL
jgi:hypothetical protein